MKLYMIEKGKLVSIQKPVFTTGDAYVVVDESVPKIYIWLGSKCSTDEKGTAAVEAKNMDDKTFNGNAKIVTYDEGTEEPEFLAKMLPLGPLKVLDKNLAKSMLKDVKTGEFAFEHVHVNALYRVSSEEFNNMDAIKYTQVPFKKESLDSEDVFIADLGVDIWVWQGKTSNNKEKTKGIQFAREFDAKRAGAQRPVIFMEGDGDQQFLDIFKGKLPKSESKVQDLKLEAFDEEKKAQAIEKGKKKGLCSMVVVSLVVISLFI